MQSDDEDDDLYERIEREAFFRMADEPEDDDTSINLLENVGTESAPTVDQPAVDLTLGGYWKLHNRPPAFEGVDGQPYTVDIDTEATNDPNRPFAAFFVFIRWAATGAGIMEHTESQDIAFGPTEEAARDAAFELTLYEVKAELDGAIERKRQELEE
jgi:hypothetical protein